MSSAYVFVSILPINLHYEQFRGHPIECSQITLPVKRMVKKPMLNLCIHMNETSLCKTIQMKDTSMFNFCDSMWSSWVEVNLCRFFLIVCLYMYWRWHWRSNYQEGRVGIPLIDLTLHMLCLSQSRNCISNLIVNPALHGISISKY